MCLSVDGGCDGNQMFRDFEGRSEGKYDYDVLCGMGCYWKLLEGVWMVLDGHKKWTIATVAKVHLCHTPHTARLL